MFRVEMLPAGNGDCLLVEYGTAGSTRRILIDGGTAGTDSSLLKRLGDGFSLELLVVSHVDCDHIDGVVKILAEKSTRGAILEVWFNGWRHLAPKTDLLGPVEGEILSALIRKRKLPWNASFAGGPVSIGKGEALPVATLPGGIQLTILSPDSKKLLALRKTWHDAVREAGLDPDNPQQAIAELEKIKKLKPEDMLGDHLPDLDALTSAGIKLDKTKANGTSIAFLAEYHDADAGRKTRCLFLADAHPDLVADSLRRLCDSRGIKRLKLDALKLSHHGSKKNLTRDILRMVECPRYLFSSNGATHGHPDQEAVALVIREGGKNPKLYFNYTSDDNEVWGKKLLQRREKYTAVYPTSPEAGLVVDL